MGKLFLFSSFIFMVVGNLTAQHILPSTVREVYNFSVGDTFMYGNSTSRIGASSPCDSYSEKQTKIVLERAINANDDTITYKYERLRKRISMYCNVFYYQDTITEVYTNLDSLIVPEPSFDSCFIDYGNLYCSNCYIDTNFVFIDNNFKIRPQTLWTSFSFDFDSLQKINCSIQYNCGWDFKGKVYADNLGLIYDYWGQESVGTYYSELVYYHKANGEAWGTPNYFEIITGVDDKNQELLLATVFPNPIKDSKVNVVAPKSYNSNLKFSLSDLAGKEIDSRIIPTEKTTFQYDNLPTGLYFWNILSDGNVVKSGKIIFQ